MIHSVPGTPVTRTTLIAEQARDPNLEVCFNRVVDASEKDKVPRCFYLHSGILMRKFRPVDGTAD